MLTLSEAIRLGAMLKPQAFEGPQGNRLDASPRSCALAAAAEAIGRKHLNCFHPKMWPWAWTQQQYKVCPSCSFRSLAGAVIAHLNDFHMWTREQIADWVQTIEAQQAVDSARQPALTESMSDRRGTTDCEQLVLATRVS